MLCQWCYKGIALYRHPFHCLVCFVDTKNVLLLVNLDFLITNLINHTYSLKIKKPLLFLLTSSNSDPLNIKVGLESS